MQKLLLAISNRKFDDAAQMFLEGDMPALHEAVLEKAYETDDPVYYDFYEHLVEKWPNDPQLHYNVAELYTTVYNILPFGYERALMHARKAVELSSGDVTYKEFILLFYQLPTPLLEKETAMRYAAEILKIDPKNQTAKYVLSM